MPTPPPPAYEGIFFLELGGSSIPLTSFAGCYDKVLGLEYEDCYFTTGLLADPVMNWVNEVLAGRNTPRDVAVVQIDQSGQIVSRIDIADAFLGDFSLSDFVATDNTAGSVQFVVVPGSLQAQANPSSSSSGATGIVFRKYLFSVSLDGVDYPSAFSLRGLHMSVPKLLLSGSGGISSGPGSRPSMTWSSESVSRDRHSRASING